MGAQTFLKVQAGSIAGSAADYLTTILLVSYFHTWYLLANFSGNIVGWTFLFILSRKWIFRSNKGSVRLQIIRFILMIAGNLLLSALGIFMITHFFGVNYLVSKMIVSILLGLSYNYFMQKNFVFT